MSKTISVSHALKNDRKTKIVMLIVATVIVVLLSVVLSHRDNGIVPRTYYGFPTTFLIIYEVGSPPRFSFDPLQLIVNVAIVWLILSLFRKAFSAVFKYLRSKLYIHKG